MQSRFSVISNHFLLSADKEGEEKEIGPTSVGPTTPGAEPWWQIRLPDNVKPYHYDLTLHIDLTKPHFSGTVQIWINVSSPTPYILLHARYMNFTKVELQTFSGGKSKDSDCHLCMCYT